MRFAMSGLASSQLPTMNDVIFTCRVSSTSSSWSARPRSPLVWNVSATRAFVVGPDTTNFATGGAVLGGVVGVLGAVGAVVAPTVVVAAPSLAPPSPPHAAASAPTPATAPRRNVRRGSGEGEPSVMGGLTVVAGTSKLRQPLVNSEARGLDAAD